MDHFYQKSLELGKNFTGPPEEQVWGGIMTHILSTVVVIHFLSYK